jgi:hypothetical protein
VAQKDEGDRRHRAGGFAVGVMAVLVNCGKLP